MIEEKAVESERNAKDGTKAGVGRPATQWTHSPDVAREDANPTRGARFVREAGWSNRLEL